MWPLWLDDDNPTPPKTSKPSKSPSPSKPNGAAEAEREDIEGVEGMDMDMGKGLNKVELVPCAAAAFSRICSIASSFWDWSSSTRSSYACLSCCSLSYVSALTFALL